MIMFNREATYYTVQSFDDEVDDYGQMRQGTPTQRQVLMMIKLYSNQLVDNPLYNDVEYIGITKDQGIKDSDKIVINGKAFDVLFVIPSGKYLQVFLKK